MAQAELFGPLFIRRQLMKKIIILVLAIIAGGALFANPQQTYAASQDYSNLPISLTVSGGNIVDGYLNSSNESIKIVASTLPIEGFLLDESMVSLSVNGVLTNFVSSIEGGIITYNLGGDLGSVFGAMANQISIEAKFTQVQVPQEDLSGQETPTQITENFIGQILTDFKAPTVTLNSPKNGAIYNKDVALDFTVQDLSADALAGVVVSSIYIDGQLTSLKSGDIISAGQGKHTIRIVALDQAGNQTTVSSEYILDNSIYFKGETYFEGSIFYLGDKIYIRGWTEAGSKVAVRLTSYDPEAIANQEGYFEIVIDSNDVGVGDYGAFVDITDPAGNFYTWEIGQLTIKRIKLAKSTSIKTDTVSKASAGAAVEVKIDENLAQKPVQIKAISDQKVVGTNWSAWIILLFAVVLASGISTAGYYGYEWLFGGSSAVVNEHATHKPQIADKNPQDKLGGKPESSDESDHSLRW